MSAWELALASEERIRAEIPDMDPSLNSTLFLLNRASAELVAEFEAQVHKPMGLSWVGYRLLYVLWIVGDVEPAKAAELTKSSRASVSSLSTSFERRGLLVRTPSTADGRSVLLSLTDKGKQLARKAIIHQEQAQQVLMGDLTETEQQILKILLSKISLVRRA